MNKDCEDSVPIAIINVIKINDVIKIKLLDFRIPILELVQD